MKNAKRVRSCLRAAATAFAVLVVTLATASEGSRWGQGYLPNVEVVDQDNRHLEFYDDVIKGKIVVISFVYTSCKSICPLVIARLREVQDMLGDAMGRDIFFVSVSIDPIPDTPEKLKEHATAFRVGPGWSFITGRPDDIDLIRFKLGERSGKEIAQHRNEVMLYNDVTGEWARDSAFADLGALAMTIRDMDPKWRNRAAVEVSSAASDSSHGTGDHQGQALFIKACAACHSIGQGDKVGPDLEGVTARRDHDWLVRYITDPARTRAGKDTVALELAQKYPAVRMPNLGMGEDDVSDLISYLDARTLALASKQDAAPRP